MNNTSIKIAALVASLFVNAGQVAAQKSIADYVKDTDREKIERSIVIGDAPVTAKGYGDGHGKNPLLTSKGQKPDTVALVTLYMYDLGSNTTTKAGNSTYVTYTSLSKHGGNTISNEIYKNSIANLKEAFRKQGVVLLTPEEYLNTPQKRNYYYKEFAPQVSKLGTVLSNLENSHTDINVAADFLRVFDISKAADFLRSESLGGDLARKLGVDAVLSIAVEIQSSKKEIDLHGFKMSLHGPNPIPKEDKKYVGQKMGTGYYEGQAYVSGSMFLKKPVQVGSFRKDNIEGLSFEGIGVVFESFINKFYATMNEATETAAKKYN